MPISGGHCRSRSKPSPESGPRESAVSASYVSDLTWPSVLRRCLVLGWKHDGQRQWSIRKNVSLYRSAVDQPELPLSRLLPVSPLEHGLLAIARPKDGALLPLSWRGRLLSTNRTPSRELVGKRRLEDGRALRWLRTQSGSRPGRLCCRARHESGCCRSHTTADHLGLRVDTV